MKYRVGGVVAAVLAAALCFCGVDVAWAETETAASGEQVPHFLFFSGTDLWRYGAFAHGGLLWSPEGVQREGFTLKLLMAGGAYRYQSGTTQIVGRQLLGAALPGWRFKQNKAETTVYLGLDLQNHSLFPDDRGNALRGTRLGLRTGADVWFEPTGATMAAGAFSVSTIRFNFWSRAQLGVRIPGVAWIGPEMHVIGDTSYKQISAGIHVTGFRTHDYEWAVGAGYVHDTDRRGGPYGRVGLNIRQ